ncbi:MAG: hypothetical protein ACI8RZ_007796 [Myxococcota bacterium]|jgi:hypothetical protein
MGGSGRSFESADGSRRAGIRLQVSCWGRWAGSTGGRRLERPAVKRPLERALTQEVQPPRTQRHERAVRPALERSGQKKHGADDGEPQPPGERAPATIPSPSRCAARGKQGAVGNIENCDPRIGGVWRWCQRPAEGTLSSRAETGLAVPPVEDSPISAFDIADLFCSPFGLLSQGRSQPRGHRIRRALPHPCAEVRHPPSHSFSGHFAKVSRTSGLDPSARSRGAALPA